MNTLRKRAVEKYYNSPKHCVQCSGIIKIGESEPVRYVRRKKFCSRTCYINSKTGQPVENAKFRYFGKSKDIFCARCQAVFTVHRNSSGAIPSRKVCDFCYKNPPRKPFSETIGKIGDFTKSELFVNRASYQSARSAVRKHAVAIFQTHHKTNSCHICGYDRHIQVAHIKSVSSFSGETLISVINDPKNLVGLCPNHHWEFDHGILSVI